MGTADKTVAEKGDKREDLQGVRGLAILFVLVMHLRPVSFRLGFVGVDMFFVLSGFLMTKILLEKDLSCSAVWTFYQRRFKRIVPLYMLLALVVYIYGYVYVILPDRKQILNDLAWVYTYTSNMQPVFQKLGYWDQLSTYRFFVHTWSLGVELQYYLIVPLIMSLASFCGSSARLILFMSLALFSVIFQLSAPPKIAYGFILSRIWQFMCGSIAYEFAGRHATTQNDYRLLVNIEEQNELNCSESPDLEDRKSQISSLSTNAIMLLTIQLVVISPHIVVDNVARILSTLLTATVIYFDAKPYTLTNPLVVYIGDISYVLYLIHWPIIVAARYYADTQHLNVSAISMVVIMSFLLSVVVHHTVEEFFMKRGVIPALVCVASCYMCILATTPQYIRTVPLESINPNESKVKYAIEWNLRESQKVYFKLPCDPDNDTHLYTNFTEEPPLRCVARGNGPVSVMLIGNSIAYRAYPLIHDILKGRFSKFRLYSRSYAAERLHTTKYTKHQKRSRVSSKKEVGASTKSDTSCPALSDWCATFSSAMRMVVEHEKPDILMNIHHSTHAPFVAPIADLKTDLIYSQFQNNVNFFSNHAKHIVIDMPYYKFEHLNTGAVLAKRLQQGLPPGDDLVVTWEQYINQTRHHRKRISSIACKKCVINEVNKAFFNDGLFYTYDTKSLLVRLGDGSHLTPVGLEMLRPLYARILDKLIKTLPN